MNWTRIWAIVACVGLFIVGNAAVTGALLGTMAELDRVEQIITEIRREQAETYRLIDYLHRQLDERQTEIDALQNHLSRREAVLSAARDCGLSEDGAQALWSAGKVYGVPHRLIIAVAQVESRCRDIVATNRDESTDHGWMQLNSGTWPWLAQMTGRTDPHDEADNIHMGTWYLAWLNDRHGGWDETLTSYNRGEGGMRAYVASRGTARSDYSRAVLASWEGD